MYVYFDLNNKSIIGVYDKFDLISKSNLIKNYFKTFGDTKILLIYNEISIDMFNLIMLNKFEVNFKNIYEKYGQNLFIDYLEEIFEAITFLQLISSEYKIINNNYKNIDIITKILKYYKTN